MTDLRHDPTTLRRPRGPLAVSVGSPSPAPSRSRSPSGPASARQAPAGGARRREPDAAENPAAGGGVASCLVYDPANLPTFDVVFDGTVTAVDGDQVTFDVNEGWKGADGSITLTAPAVDVALVGPLPDFEVGGRYLVTAAGSTDQRVRLHARLRRRDGGGLGGGLRRLTLPIHRHARPRRKAGPRGFRVPEATILLDSRLRGERSANQTRSAATMKSAGGPTAGRRSWIVVGLACVLASALAGCGHDQGPVPAGAQQVHVEVAGSEVRLDPATVRAGDVYVVLDTPGSASASPNPGDRHGDAGPVDRRGHRSTRTRRYAGNQHRRVRQFGLLRRAACGEPWPDGPLRERVQDRRDTREVRVLRRQPRWHAAG